MENQTGTMRRIAREKRDGEARDRLYASTPFDNTESRQVMRKRRRTACQQECRRHEGNGRDWRNYLAIPA